MSIPIPPTSVTPSAYPQSESVRREIERSTWYDFASILLFLVGTLNVIDGIAAISNSSYVVDRVLFSDLTAWGWFFLIWGAIQIVAAFGIYKNQAWAVVPAVITVFVNAVSHLAAARTYPIWSVTIVVLDVFVLYALIVHSGRTREAVS